jgi:hypothetical protein
VPHLISIMHVPAEGEELLLDFYRKRKIRYVWDEMPGVIDYKVFSIVERANRDGKNDRPYQIAAVVEVEDVDAFMDAFYTEEVQGFVGEYAPLFRPENEGGGIYTAELLEAEAALSKAEFWEGRSVEGAAS